LAKLGINIKGIKGIIEISKKISLNDCYLIVNNKFVGTFADYNLYDNRFNHILAQIAFTGQGEWQLHKIFYCLPRR